ncbi:hypothetical protein QUB56_26670 [Microcoleus sp. AR_TQ3_B6]
MQPINMDFPSDTELGAKRFLGLELATWYEQFFPLGSLQALTSVG